MSNLFWGWGLEDDNLRERIGFMSLTLDRALSPYSCYRSLTETHHGTRRIPQEYERNRGIFKLEDRLNMYLHDGLNTLQYKLLASLHFRSYSVFKVAI